MRILLIEDEETEAQDLAQLLHSAPVPVEIELANSRDEAITRLDGGTYDLVICDMRIPSSASALDESIEHGVRVHSYLTENHPGIPVMLISGYADRKTVAREIESRPWGDPFGEGEARPLTSFRDKDEIPELVAGVFQLAERLSVIDSIEISTLLLTVDLTDDEERVIRLIAAAHRGRLARIQPLEGGLSESKTYRIDVEDENGSPTLRTVVKLGALVSVKEEERRYSQYIHPLLGATAFAGIVSTIESGAHDSGGLLLSLAHEFDQSLFAYMEGDPDSGPELVARLRRNLNPLREGPVRMEIALEGIRSEIATTDDRHKVERILETDLSSFEARNLQISRCIKHGDLHGANVLVDGDGRPLVIDCSRAGPGASAFDPVTLELSLLFHPKGQEVSRDWPTADQTRHWDDLATYLNGCRYPEFIKACRDWALGESAGDLEIIACLYAIAVRQARYPENEAYARSLLEVAQRRLA